MNEKKEEECFLCWFQFGLICEVRSTKSSDFSRKLEIEFNSIQSRSHFSNVFVLVSFSLKNEKKNKKIVQYVQFPWHWMHWIYGCQCLPSFPPERDGQKCITYRCISECKRMRSEKKTRPSLSHEICSASFHAVWRGEGVSRLGSPMWLQFGITALVAAVYFSFYFSCFACLLRFFFRVLSLSSFHNFAESFAHSAIYANILYGRTCDGFGLQACIKWFAPFLLCVLRALILPTFFFCWYISGSVLICQVSAHFQCFYSTHSLARLLARPSDRPPARSFAHSFPPHRQQIADFFFCFRTINNLFQCI